MEEFISLSSSTPGPTMGYDNYLTLLQNACIRYDSNLKSRPSPASRAAYQHELSPDQHDNPYPQDYSSSGTTYGGIDMPAEEFYQGHTTNLNRIPNVSTTTLIPRTTPPQAPPMVALTCQLKNSTRFTLLTSIGLLMSPPLPLGSLLLPILLVDPLPGGLLAPSFFLPTYTNF